MAALGASSVLVVATAVTFCTCRVIPPPIREEGPEGVPFHQVNHAPPMTNPRVRNDPKQNTPEAVTPLRRSFHHQPPEDKRHIVSGSRGGHGFDPGHRLSSQPNYSSDYDIVAELWRGAADREGGRFVENEPLLKTQTGPAEFNEALHVREIETSVLSGDRVTPAVDRDGSSTAAPRLGFAKAHRFVNSRDNNNGSTELSTNSGGYVPFNSLTLLKNKKPSSAEQQLQWPYFVTQSDSQDAQKEVSGNYRQEEYLRVTPDMIENKNTSQRGLGVSQLGTLAITTQPKIFNNGKGDSQLSYFSPAKSEISTNETDLAYQSASTGELAPPESHNNISQNTDRFYANVANKTTHSVGGKNVSVPVANSIPIQTHGAANKAGQESPNTTVQVKNSSNTTRPAASSPMTGRDRTAVSKPSDREIDNQLSESTIAVITLPPAGIVPGGVRADSATVTKAGVIQSPVGTATAPAPAPHAFQQPSLGTPLEHPAERLESNFSIDTDTLQALSQTDDFLHVSMLETTTEEAVKLAENRIAMKGRNHTMRDDEAGTTIPSDDLKATRLDGLSETSLNHQPAGTHNLAGAVGHLDEEDADLSESLQSGPMTTTKNVIHQSEVSSSGAMDDYRKPELDSLKLGTAPSSYQSRERQTHSATQSEVTTPVATIKPEVSSVDRAGQQKLPSTPAVAPTIPSVSFSEPIWLTLAKNGTVPTTQVSKSEVRRTEEVPQHSDHLIKEFLESEQEGSGLHETNLNYDSTMVSENEPKEQHPPTTSKPSQGPAAATTTVKTGYAHPMRKQANSQPSTSRLKTNASHEIHPSNDSKTLKGQHVLSKSGLLDRPSTPVATQQHSPSYKSHSSRPAQLIETLDEVYDYADYYYDELNLGEGGEYQGEDLPKKPTFKPLKWPYTHFYNIKLYPNGTSKEEDHHPLFVTAKPTPTQRPTTLETPLTENTNDGQYSQNIATNDGDNEATSNLEPNPALTFDTADEDDYLYGTVVLNGAHDDENEDTSTPSPLLYTFAQFNGYTPASSPAPDDETKVQSVAQKPANGGVPQFLDFLIPIKQHTTQTEETTSTPASTSASAQNLMTSSPLQTIRNASAETAETTRSFSYSRQTNPYDASAEFYEMWSQRRTTPSHSYPPSRTSPHHAASPSPSASAITVLGSDHVTKPNRYGGIIETHSSYDSDPNPFDFIELNTQPERATLPPSTTRVQIELSMMPTTPETSGLTERPPAAVSDAPASLVGGPSDFFLQALQKQGHTSYSEKPQASYPPTVGGVSLTSSPTSAATSEVASWQTSRPTTVFRQGTTRPRRPQPSASTIVHPITSLYRPRPTSQSPITPPSSSLFPSRPSRPPYRPPPVSSFPGTGTTSYTFPAKSPAKSRPTQSPVITKQTFEMVSNPESHSTLPVTLRPLSCVTTGSGTVCQPKPSVSAGPARPRPTIVTRPELAARPPDTFLPTHARPHVVFLDKPLLDGGIELEPHESAELPRPLLGQALHRPGQAESQPSLITTGGETVHFQTSPGADTAHSTGPEKPTDQGLGTGSTPPSITVTTDALTVHKASLFPSKQTSASSQDTGMNQPQATTPMTPQSFPFYNTASSPRPTPDISYMRPSHGQMAYPASYYPSQQGTYDSSSYGSSSGIYPSASPSESPGTIPPEADPTPATPAQTNTDDSTQPSTTLTKVSTTTISPPPAVHPTTYGEGTDLHLNSHREPTEQQSYAVVNVWKRVSGELKLIGQQLVPVDQVLGTELGNGEMLDANQLPGHIISQLADALNLTSIRDSFSQTTELDSAYDVSVMTTASPVMTTSSYESYTESGENVNKIPADADDSPSPTPTTSSYVSYNGDGHQAALHSEDSQTAPNSNIFDGQFGMTADLSPPRPSQDSGLGGLFAAPTNHAFFGPTKPPVTTIRQPSTNYYDSLLFKFTSKPGRESTTPNPPQQSQQDIPAEAQFSGTHQEGILYNLPGFQDFIQAQLFTNPEPSTKKPEPAAVDDSAEIPKPTESSYISYEAPWLSTTKTPAPNHSNHPPVNFNHQETRPVTPEIMNLLQSMQAHSPSGSQNQNVIAAVTNASLSMLPDEILRLLGEIKKNPDRGNLTLLSLFGGQEEGSLKFNGANVGVTKGTLGIQINQLNVSQASSEVSTTPSYSNEETFTHSPPGDQGKVVSGILDLLRPDRSTTSRAMFTQAPGEPGKGITRRPSDTMLLLQALKMKPLYSRSSSTTMPGPYMNLHPVGDATPIRLSQFVPNLAPQQPDVVNGRNETNPGHSSNHLQQEPESGLNAVNNFHGSQVGGTYEINTKVLAQLQHALSHIMTEPPAHQETTQRTSTPRYSPPNPPLQTSGTYSYHYNHMPPAPPPPLQVISSESQSMLQTLGDRLGIENPQLLAAIVLSILPTVALAMPVLGRRRRSTRNEVEQLNEIPLPRLSDGPSGAQDTISNNIGQMLHASEPSDPVARATKAAFDSSRRGRSGGRIDLDSIQLIGMDAQAEIRDKHPSLYSQFEQFGQRIKNQLVKIDPEQLRTETVHQEQAQLTTSEDWKEDYEAGKVVDMRKHSERLVSWLLRVLTVPVAYDNNLRQELLGRKASNRR